MCLVFYGSVCNIESEVGLGLFNEVRRASALFRVPQLDGIYWLPFKFVGTKSTTLSGGRTFSWCI